MCQRHTKSARYSYTIVYDLLRSSTICHDLPRSSTIFYDLLRSSTICHDLLRSATIFYDLPRSSTIFYAAAIRSDTILDASSLLAYVPIGRVSLNALLRLVSVLTTAASGYKIHGKQIVSRLASLQSSTYGIFTSTRKMRMQ